MLCRYRIIDAILIDISHHAWHRAFAAIEAPLRLPQHKGDQRSREISLRRREIPPGIISPLYFTALIDNKIDAWLGSLYSAVVLALCRNVALVSHQPKRRWL